ncbi:MAG: adenylyltransferase/cytidyltransferase family protein [Candidatus Falkowbacteria bacterium]
MDKIITPTNKKIFGYTTGVFDLFHIGHLNMLRNSKSMCDHLTVGVTSDELVSYKHKKAVIPFKERFEIVRGIKYVDAVVGQYEIDKFVAWEKLKFDVLFVADCWHRDEKWNEYERKLNNVGVKVIYIPYTQGISSTLINEVLLKLRNG